MRLSIKQGLAATALVLAASSVFAQPVPQGPGPVPRAGDSNAGGVSLAVWNTSSSVTQYLNLRMDDIQVSQLTPSGGLVLDFGNINLAPFGGNLSNVSYNVVGGDYFGDNPSLWQVSFTGALDQTPVSVFNSDTMNSALGVLNNFQNFVNTTCGTTNPCISTNAADPHYAGGPNFGAGVGGALWDTTALVGTALSFWTLTSTEDFLGGAATLARYQSPSQFGRWLLDLDGHLTYTFNGTGGPVVPLPAAIWLLLSGLGGLGVIGRRRNIAAA